MDNPVGAIRYAIRQFRLSPVFTASAVLTLSLGIGGTTAIFTLIDAVMLRSLSVADPDTLYRIGDRDNCCVQGGPQDRWGMFSYPLFGRSPDARRSPLASRCAAWSDRLELLGYAVYLRGVPMPAPTARCARSSG
jgi:hypothetical protein